MILDAAAGNRTMWNWKNVPDIIYIDIEKKLERKPTVFADNTNTPFLNATFDTIFYDPPHSWRQDQFWASFPTTEEYNKMYKPKSSIPTYYGWDKYKTKQALAAHIYYAQKEFLRILKDDGLLWLKWNEVGMPLRKILAVFDKWVELMRIYVDSPAQSAGMTQTFWICMTKKREKEMQTRLG